MAPREYRFGRFTLRPARRELLADGRPQKLGRRGYDLLLALVERAGEAVSRDDLFERVWRGRVVIDDNLKVQVMGLRALLGADAVVTVPGHGYRFGLPVTAVNPEDGARPPDVDDGMQAPETAAARQAALIGRDADLAELLGLLAAGHVVTVVGSGGVGKTRLALAAAAAAGRRFPDGSAVVELAGIADPQLVVPSVVRQLRLPQKGEGQTPETLARAVAPLSLLLVLDNCEHLLDAGAELVAALLEVAPRVAVLATSQEPLRVPSERLLRISGLPLPADAAPPDEVAASAAGQLFAARTRALDPAFRVDARNAAAVAALCRRVDGIPLALELAAARVPLLGVDGVLARLDEQLQLLSRGSRTAPTRQQTLRAALQWSHALLDTAQKAVFRRLAVFADSFAVDAAERVCAVADDDRWQVLDALQALVDKSLVSAITDANGSRRLRLLVTAREFAFERLVEASERDATQDRHADAVLATFDRALEQVTDTPMLPWLERYWPDVADLRAALRWASGAGRDRQRLVALVGVAAYFFNAAGLDREAQRWLDVARPLVDDSTPALRAARYWQAAAYRSVDPVAQIGDALAAAARAAELYRAHGDAVGEYRMLGIQAHHGRRVAPPLDAAALLARMRALERPEWSAALKSVRRRPEGVALARSGQWQAYRDHFAADALDAEANGDDLHRWACQHHVSIADIALGEPARAAAGMRPVVRQLRELGYFRWQWTRPAVLLMALIEAGDVNEATALLKETLPLLQVAGAVDWMPEYMALWASVVGFTEDAACLLGWADAALARKGGVEAGDVLRRRVIEQVEARLAAALARDDAVALRTAGRAWSDADALHRLLALAARGEAARGEAAFR